MIIGILVLYQKSINSNKSIIIIKLNIEKDNTSSIGNNYIGRSFQFYTHNPNDDSKEISIMNRVVLI